MSSKEDIKVSQKHDGQNDEDHWRIQRKKARKTAIVLGLLAVALAVWSVVMVVIEAKG